MHRFWVAALFAAGAMAQQPPLDQRPLPTGVFRPGGSIQAPQVVTRVEPNYSDEARLAKLEGSILLSLIVDKEGRAREIRVEQPLGLGLDESAVTNIGHWTFRPGVKDGKPVDVLVNVEVFFRQPRELWDWHLAQAKFDAPAGVSRPLVLKTRYPPVSDSEENVAVRLVFDVDTNGAPRNVRVERSSDSKWETEITTAFSEGWRFQPGAQDGKPVAVQGRFDFVRGSHSPIPLR